MNRAEWELNAAASALKRSAWERARNVLCVRLDSMGDVLMCTPAMRALRQANPERWLTLLTSHSGAAVAPYIDEVDAVMNYAAPWMKASAPGVAQADLTLIGILAARRFDAAVIFTSYSQSPLPAALMCYLAGIPLRLAHCHENPYHLLTDWITDPEPTSMLRHEVQRQLDLVASLGCQASGAQLSFTLHEADLEAVSDKLAACGLDTARPWVLIHPGATAASRRYPTQHLAAVVRELRQRYAIPVVLAGGPEDAALVEQVARLSTVATYSVCGKLSLGELGAAIKLASVAVLNNSGPAHMAAALGTPFVNLYALTNPQHTPWQAKARVLFHDVSCRFCYKSECPQQHHDCLDKVEPAQVVEAVLSLLEDRDI